MSCKYKNECPSYSGWCEASDIDYSKCIPFLITAHEIIAKELEAYKHLEKSGRLVKLPCKVGDTACWIDPDNKVIELTVIGFWAHGLGSDPLVEAEYMRDGIIHTDYFKFGKTVFLTREEAEAALKGADE